MGKHKSYVALVQVHEQPNGSLIENLLFGAECVMLTSLVFTVTVYCARIKTQAKTQVLSWDRIAVFCYCHCSAFNKTCLYNKPNLIEVGWVER